MRRRYIPVFIAALASVPAAAQTYKWVDERGVVTYGTKPPAGRPAQLVDTQSRNTIDTADVAKREADTRQAAPSPAPVPPIAARPVRGMDFDTYVRLSRGMSEGELLTRAGRPDHVSLDRIDDMVKSFYYYPTAADPFITIVTVRSGGTARQSRNENRDVAPPHRQSGSSGTSVTHVRQRPRGEV